MGIIDIDKKSVPYTFDLELSSRVYTFTINYNCLFDYFTMDLELNKKILVKGEKMVLNQVLFKQHAEDKENNLYNVFFTEILIPLSNSDSIERITYSNLGKEVLVYYAERSELNE